MIQRTTSINKHDSVPKSAKPDRCGLQAGCFGVNTPGGSLMERLDTLMNSQGDPHVLTFFSSALFPHLLPGCLVSSQPLPCVSWPYPGWRIRRRGDREYPFRRRRLFRFHHRANGWLRRPRAPYGVWKGHKLVAGLCRHHFYRARGARRYPCGFKSVARVTRSGMTSID